MTRQARAIIDLLITPKNRNDYNKSPEKYLFAADLLREHDLEGTDEEVDYLEDCFEGVRP